jgi:hypothetical protein
VDALVDLLAVSMKLATFVGVLVAATGMNLPDLRKGLGLRFFALGATGVALMIANAWLAVSPLALVLDVAYAATCVWVLVRGLQREREEFATFSIVGEAS